jgi:hypothetical protein
VSWLFVDCRQLITETDVTHRKKIMTDKGRVFRIKGTSLFCTLETQYNIFIIITELLVRDSYGPVLHLNSKLLHDYKFLLKISLSL